MTSVAAFPIGNAITDHRQLVWRATLGAARGNRSDPNGIKLKALLDAGGFRDKPEACWRIAGGEVRHERNPQMAQETRCAPKAPPGAAVIASGAQPVFRWLRGVALVPHFTPG